LQVWGASLKFKIPKFFDLDYSFTLKISVFVLLLRKKKQVSVFTGTLSYKNKKRE